MASKKDIKKSVSERDIFIGTMFNGVIERVESYQSYYYDSIINAIYSSDLEDVSDVLMNIYAFERDDKEYEKLKKWYSKKLESLITLAASYYLLYNIERDEELEQPVVDFIDNHIKSMDSFRQEIRMFVASMVLGNDNLSTIKSNISNKIRGDGIISKYMIPKMKDATLQIVRGVDYRYSKKNELEFAYYLGGLIETSRCFCTERDQQIWSLENINSWNNLSWRGKIDGVDVKLALGGYNCRHYLMYTDEETANKYGYDNEYTSCE